MVSRVMTSASRRSTTAEPLASSPNLRDGGNDPGNILRPRQTVITVLDHGQHHVLRRKPLDQLERMLPGHIRILSALQDSDRTSNVDRTAEQKVVASFVDQVSGDRIGRTVAILRGPQPDALAFDLI